VVNKWKHIETSGKHMLNEWNRMVTNRRQNKDFNDYLHRSDDDLRCDTTGRMLLL